MEPTITNYLPPPHRHNITMIESTGNTTRYIPIEKQKDITIFHDYHTWRSRVGWNDGSVRARANTKVDKVAEANPIHVSQQWDA